MSIYVSMYFIKSPSLLGQSKKVLHQAKKVDDYLNMGVEVSTGQFVHVLETDIRWKPDLPGEK